MVVSNTTPLSELAKIGQLGLLHEVYGGVAVPSEVYDEVTAGNHPAAGQVRTAAWLSVHLVSDGQRIGRLQEETGLGLGECAAIVLAEEVDASLVLIDDLAARRVAEDRGLPVAGTIATLLLAKRRGILAAVRPLLDDLVAHGTRIGRRLYDEALQLAGE